MREVKSKRAIPILFLIALLSSCGGGAPADRLDGVLSFISGEVLLNRKAANLSDTIRYGDTIETRGKSTCRIVVDGKNLISMGKETRLVYRIKKGDGRIEFNRGLLGAIIRNRAGMQEFRVTMPTVSAAVRGTILFMAVEGEGKAYACVCNGTVVLQPPGQGEEVISAKHHRANYYIKEKERVVIKKAGLDNHDDKSMEEMASSIGVKIDWTRIE